MATRNKNIYRKLPCKWTYAANLTTSPIYCEYFGRYGMSLPAGSASSTPQRVLLRHPICSRKRKNLSVMLANDAPFVAGSSEIDTAAAKVSYGTSAEVQADITAKFGSPSGT